MDERLRKVRALQAQESIAKLTQETHANVKALLDRTSGTPSEPAKIDNSEVMERLDKLEELFGRVYSMLADFINQHATAYEDEEAQEGPQEAPRASRRKKGG